MMLERFNKSDTKKIEYHLLWFMIIIFMMEENIDEFVHRNIFEKVKIELALCLCYYLRNVHQFIKFC